MLLIILPVRNEEQRVVETAKRVSDYLKEEMEVLFVDDGSTDGTFKVLKDFSHSRIKVIRNRFDGGKGSALKAGYIMSDTMYKMQDDDLICFLDGDGQINPTEIDTLLRVMFFYNADCVLGNKRHLYSSSKYTLTRRIISETYNFIIRMFFDIKLKDTQCGIKLFRKGCLENIIGVVNVKRYAFDLELIVAIKENGYRVADAPVSVGYQMNRGAIGLGSITSTFFDTIKILINKINGKYLCQR